MKLDLRENSGVSVLVLSGNLTVGVERDLRDSIDTLLGSGRSRILLDMTQVDFVDSAGIGELVASYRTVDRFGGKLKMLRPSPRVEESLSLTQLLPIFDVYEDEEAAVASFTPPAD